MAISLRSVRSVVGDTVEVVNANAEQQRKHTEAIREIGQHVRILLEERARDRERCGTVWGRVRWLLRGDA